MKELLDQTTRTMKQTWELWQQMLVKAPWLEVPGTLPLSQWNSWLSTMKAAYDMNTGLWKGLLDQGEENFFKYFKQSPLWNETAESHMREVWSGLKKAQETQLDALNTQWRKMEDLIKNVSSE